MRKKQIGSIPELFVLDEDGDMESKSFQIELITPMFGGDAQSWKLDTNNPVRGQSIKGHLRFWWRTMQNESDPKKLLFKENQIWGGRVAENQESENKPDRIKSRVSLFVSDFNIPQTAIVEAEKRNQHSVKDDVIPSNVLFPIVSEVKKNESINFIKEMRFTLNIKYPQKYAQEVLNSLKLWVLLGGVGARTRRGTGSLYCEELMQSYHKASDILEFVRSIASTNQAGRLPYARLDGFKFYYKEFDGVPANIWHALLTSYGQYRQNRKPAPSKSAPPKNGQSKGGQTKPGRSYWPEPDAIRKITEKNAKRHELQHDDCEKPWFPRAALGLPIITKFTTSGDPGEGGGISLETDIGTGDRFPSPVILKVIKLPNQKVIKCTVILNQSFPERLKLKVGAERYSIDGDMLPFHPNYKTTRIMRKYSPLDGRSIYRDLADYLQLEELT